MLRRIFANRQSKSGRAPLAENELSADSQIDERTTNLVYQDYRDSKGGSDSARKFDALHLPPLNGKRFLDLGCNAGYFCARAAELGASRVLGVDVSEKIIALAQERHPQLEFRSGGWDDYPAGEFDVVICLSAIHYARDPVRLADDVYRSLSKGGLFVLEGGLYSATQPPWSDVLLPVWREVGDRVRHLTRGYVERHLFPGFDWKIVAESIPQGGDPLQRYVVHATPHEVRQLVQRPAHRVCLKEFARGLALSAASISDGQPSHTYVRQLAEICVDDPDAVVDVLGRDDNLASFAADLVYALGTHRAQLLIRISMDEHFLKEVRDRLSADGIRVSLTHD